MLTDLPNVLTLSRIAAIPLLIALAALRHGNHDVRRPLLIACTPAALVRPVLQLGLRDEFIEHGDPAKLLSLQGLDAAGIRQAIERRYVLQAEQN